MAEIYKNEDRKCECFKCEFEEKCVYAYRYQRLGRENNGALGKCGKLKENNGKLQYWDFWKVKIKKSIWSR